MMDFARARPSARAAVKINRILEQSLHLASFDKGFQRLGLTMRLSELDPVVFGDADQLQQVFLNLLLNSRDAMPDGGEIVVYTTFDESHEGIVVEIADSGIGIAAENLSHIFDPFFTTKPAGAGTGLGLSVCYGIVTAHGGRIEVRANNGKGTRVRVILPARSPEEALCQ
jgi:two-component system NtrC family sensor kinase